MTHKPFARLGLLLLFTLLVPLGVIAAPNARQEAPPTPTPPPTPPPVSLPLLLKAPRFAYPEHILIPAGTFLMGCDEAHSAGFICYDGALPLHTVYLDAYLIDTTEVTNAEYAACVGANKCDPPKSLSSAHRGDYYGNPLYDHYPVLFVDWLMANDYCAWAGGSLPTEAQWEKAARGSLDTRPYPWGDQLPDCTLANILIPTIGCVYDTSEVGSYPNGASVYGALDMSGNVIEWVSDWRDYDYYKISPYENPTGPLYGEYKVLRGGSWVNDADRARIDYRTGDYPYYVWNNVGFRCAYPAVP